MDDSFYSHSHKDGNEGQPVRRAARAGAAAALAAMLFSSTALAGPAGAKMAAAAACGGGQMADPLRALDLGLIGGLGLVCLLGGGGLIMALRMARQRLAVLASEQRRAGEELARLKAALGASSQIVLETSPASQPRLVFNSFANDAGIPANAGQLSDFSSWLAGGVDELQEAVGRLRERGQHFCLNVSTRHGILLEAEGQTAHGRAIIAFRDLSASQRREVQLLKRLESSSRQLDAARKLFDHLPMPVWMRDAGQGLIWVNNAYVRAVDADSREQVCTRQIELLENRQLGQSAQALASDGHFEQKMHIHLGGKRRSFKVTGAAIGNCQLMMAADVEASERAQGALKAHNEAHERILDEVAEAVAIFDHERRLTFFNRAYAEFWSLDEKWLRGGPREGEILDRLRSRRLLPEQIDFRGWKAEWLSAYATHEQREDKWFLPDGRMVHVIAGPNPDGGMTYLFNNLTEKLNLQSSFNALVNVQRETLDALREGVAVFGPDGRLRLSNPAFRSIWELTGEDMDGQPHIEEVIHLCRRLYDSDDDWDAFRRAITALDDERQAFEGRIQRLDGMVLGFASVPLPDGGTLLTFVDMTDEERAEQALREKNRALESADQLKSDFLSNISYELRTPLTTIIGYGEMLESGAAGELNERQKEYLAPITASGARLEAIISNILDLVTIDAGSFELNREMVSVSEILKAARLLVRERLEKAELSLDIDIEGDVSSIYADGRRVIQVLYNLLQNAISFSGPGKTIRLIAARQGSMVAFTIEDQGCGIPEDIRNSLFERFEGRSQGTGRRGVGLGLSIVNSIVELHGGDVELLSREGVGTRITVRFPRQAPPDMVAAAE